MTRISCDMCMDLMPLVLDGIASEDSRRAVESHLGTCEKCRAVYDGEIPGVPDVKGAFNKAMKQVRLFALVLMMFGIFFGLSLTAGSDMFYNSIIMPVIGALGYVIFRWKAAYIVPGLLVVTDLVTWALDALRGANEVELISMFWWTVIYCLFVWLGTLIAGLLHFALRKEK